MIKLSRRNVLIAAAGIAVMAVAAGLYG